MHAFSHIFTTDLVANDCRVFDWLGALIKKRRETCVFVIYCLVSDKNRRNAALLIAPVLNHFCFVIYDAVTLNNCYLRPL